MDTYRIDNLTFTYPGRETPALLEVSLNIERGQFVTLCGPSGCGKTTLLRQLKPSTAPHGARDGTVFFEGRSLDELDLREASSKIGFVMQSPENQIVTDKVWHELAFGLESLGVKTPEIRLRVAEMASFFGIQTWFHKPVTELSGGQKQLLALASIMALQPTALILDEPTSQLDPIAAGEFIATIGKINRELGITVILTEHRLEEALPLSHRAVVMDAGRIVADGLPRDVALQLRGQGSGMFLAMPAPMRIWAAVTSKENSACVSDRSHMQDSGLEDSASVAPVTVRDGADWLSRQVIMHTDFAEYDAGRTGGTSSTSNTGSTDGVGSAAVRLDEVWFKYEKNLPDVIKGLSFQANYGEVTAILGGNGTGKTTTLALVGGMHKPYRGKVSAGEAIYMLPQNPQTLFVAKTVREDLLEVLSDQKIPKEEKQRRLTVMVKLCRLEGLLESHPYDLSGGEQQRAALAKVLLLQPKILLLDEPTKGLDAEFKQVFAAILHRLTDAGVAVVMASHDVEFCAEYADRCALFFDGGIVTENAPRDFFAGNNFYTTSANRMARAFLPEAVTVNDVIWALSGDKIPEREILDMDAQYDTTPVAMDMSKMEQALTLRRKIIAGFFIAWLAAAAVFTGLHFDGFIQFISGGSEAVRIADEGAPLYVGIMLALAFGVAGLTFTLTWNREKREEAQQIVLEKGKLPKRTIAAAVMILLAIPLTIYAGTYFFGDRKYYFISLLIILETMLPFALLFESRKPQARELVIISVLCAIAVAGRTAFFMLPQFKPVLALVIIAGVAFGGESGFLVGAMTGFVSNMFFGQGPWTPWQMFAFGVIGFLAGVLFRKGLLRRTPASLAAFGAFAAVLVYGVIADTSMVLIYQTNINRPMLMAAYLQGIPFNLVHGAATVVFLAIIARPMLEKLDRIKLKYGLVE